MKVITVIFGDAENATPRNTQKYCFRTKSDVKPGDKLRSRDYNHDMTVMDILDKDYKYYHADTGDLSNEITSTRCWPIKTLKVVKLNDSVTYASIIK